MPERDETSPLLTAAPGLLALGAGLPAGPSVQSYLSGETVKQVACGLDHSAVVCHSGRVFTFRSEGETYRESAPSLVAMPATVRVTQAACGHYYTVLVTDTGEVYSCGENDLGQLGLGHTNTTPLPALVPGLPPIRRVAAGWRHTVALAGTGQVWVTGFQAGLGLKVNQTSFVLVPDLTDFIVDISCGWLHTALLSANRDLLMTGQNLCGQLGLDAIEYKYSLVSSGVVAVSCGSHYTVVLGTDGVVWSFGLNSEGQLGTGDTADRSSPTRMVGLEGHNITGVVAGVDHTALLTDRGDVLVCGRGEDGELGWGRENLTVPTLLPRSSEIFVNQIAFAEKYSLILVKKLMNITSTSSGVTGQDDRCLVVTDVERSIMRSQECPICLKIMCPPINMCLNGHSLCNSCRLHALITVCPLCQKGFGTARNRTLESLVTDILLPCLDCLLRMPAAELEGHSTVCPCRKYTCPLERSCRWSGRPDTMLAHTTSAHPGQTWTDLPHLFLHSTADDFVLTNVLAAHGKVFTLHRRFIQARGEFRAVVGIIGPPEDALKFKLELMLISDSENIIYSRNICASIDSVDDAFLSPNCVAMDRTSVRKFLQRGSLVCQMIIIIEKKSEDLTEKIEALFAA